MFKESMAENFRTENITNIRSTMYTSRINTKTHLDGLTVKPQIRTGEEIKAAEKKEIIPEKAAELKYKGNGDNEIISKY